MQGTDDQRQINNCATERNAVTHSLLVDGLCLPTRHLLPVLGRNRGIKLVTLLFFLYLLMSTKRRLLFKREFLLGNRLLNCSPENVRIWTVLSHRIYYPPELIALM